MHLPRNVISVCVFGSMARGDYDGSSDADILVVVEDRSGKVCEDLVADYVRPWVAQLPTISWYGRHRLQSMFRNGHLFAWHLYLESKVLWGPSAIVDVFGRPAPYKDALLDMSSFHEVIEGVPHALRHCMNNAIYEMGLLYVCVRNIAMSASWHFCGEPDFTRYSPFNPKLRELCATRRSYELAMSCRMASQRGLRIANPVDTDTVLELQNTAVSWSQGIKEDVEENVRPQSCPSEA